MAPLTSNESCKTNNGPPVLTNEKQAFVLQSQTISDSVNYLPASLVAYECYISLFFKCQSK